MRAGVGPALTSDVLVDSRGVARVAALDKRGKTTSASTTLIAAWSALLVIVDIGFGRAPLGAVLTGAFVLQVAPSLLSAGDTRSR
jgi:pseudouridine-5'-phosphate glycosidase